MTAWMWVVVAVAGMLAESLFIGVAVARILGTIGEEIADLLEAESWTSAPLTRQTEALAAAGKIVAGATARSEHSSRT